MEMTIRQKFIQLLGFAVMFSCVSLVGCRGGGVSGSSSGSGGGSGSGGVTGPNLIPPGSADTPNPPRTPSLPIPTANPFGGGGGTGGGGGGGSTPSLGSISLDPGPTAGGTTRTLNSVDISLANGPEVGLSIGLANTNSFEVVSELDGRLLITAALFDPTGDTVLQADANALPKTLATFQDFDLNVLNYVTSGLDPAVETGTYVQSLSTNGVSTDTIRMSVIAKNDPDFSGGTVRVNIFLVGEEANDSPTVSAIDTGVDVWRTIFAQGGLSLDVRSLERSGDDDLLPRPDLGSSYYARNAGSPDAQDFAVNVFIGEDIDIEFAGVLGIAGGIPGPGIAALRSAVAISLLEHAGADNVFSAAEATLLGETMAHEAGHFLGLFHPVETEDGESFFEGDSLPDTSACSSRDDCIAAGVAENLMFPRAISTIVQQDLTANQTRVINVQAIVD